MTRPQDKAGRARRAVLRTVLAILILIAGGALLYQMFGPPRAERERQMIMLRQELAALPAYPGSTLTQDTDFNVLLHSPLIEQSYNLTASCSDTHVYYTRLAVSKAWSVYESTKDLGSGVLHTEFHKKIKEDTLDPSLECFIDETQSPDYSLDIETL